MRKSRTLGALLCLGAATTTAIVSGFHTCVVSRSRLPRWQPQRSLGRQMPAKERRQGDSSSSSSGRVGPSLWPVPTVRCAPLPAGDDNYVSAAARWGTPECVGALFLPCLKGTLSRKVLSLQMIHRRLDAAAAVLAPCARDAAIVVMLRRLCFERCLSPCQARDK